MSELLNNTNQFDSTEPSDSDENIIESFFQKAFTHYEEGKYDESISAYENVLDLDPNHLPTHINLGDIYYL